MKRYTLLIILGFLFYSINAMEMSEAEPIETKQEEDFPLKYLDASKYDQEQRCFTTGPLSLTHLASEQVAQNFLAFGKHINGKTIDECAPEIEKGFVRLPVDLHPLVTQQFFLHCFEHSWNVNYAKPNVQCKNSILVSNQKTLTIKSIDKTTPQELSFERAIRRHPLSPDHQLLAVTLEDSSIHFFRNGDNIWNKVELAEDDKLIQNGRSLTFLNNTTCISSFLETVHIWEEHNNQMRCTTQTPIVGTIKEVFPSHAENQFIILTGKEFLCSFVKTGNEWIHNYCETGPLCTIEKFKKSNNTPHYAAKVFHALTLAELRLAQAQHPELDLYDIQNFGKVLMWENKNGNVELVKAVDLKERGLHLVDFENGIATLGKGKPKNYMSPMKKRSTRTCINSDGKVVAKRKFVSDYSSAAATVFPYLFLINTNPPLQAILASIAYSNSRTDIKKLEALKDSRTMQNLPEEYKNQINEKIEKAFKKLENIAKITTDYKS